MPLCPVLVDILYFQRRLKGKWECRQENLERETVVERVCSTTFFVQKIREIEINVKVKTRLEKPVKTAKRYNHNFMEKLIFCNEFSLLDYVFCYIIL